MDEPWWALERVQGIRALGYRFYEIQELDEEGNTAEAIEKLHQVLPANEGQVFVPEWAERALRNHLRDTIWHSVSPAMWDAVFRISRILFSEDNGEITPLATPMQLVARYGAGDQDARLLHFARMGFDFTPTQEQAIQRNQSRWPRTAAFIDPRQWSMAVHRTLPPEEQRIIITVLLCAQHLMPRLPFELWLQIFEFLRRRDLRQ